MPVKFEKNAYDPVQRRKDGLRIIATRFWPRGLGKSAADLYLPDLAPSKGLLRDIQDDEITWREFAKRYRAEMKSQKSHLRTLNWLSKRGDALTVMCTCDGPDRCHRRLLASLIKRGG